jgi:hypothetical protein
VTRGTRCCDQAGKATIGIEGRNLITVADSTGARVRCAEEHLPINPLHEYGFDRMLSEAYDGVGDLGEKWLDLLPDVCENFEELFR